VVGPKLINDNEYNWIHTTNSHICFGIGRERRKVRVKGVNFKVGDCQVICDRVRSETLTKR